MVPSQQFVPIEDIRDDLVFLKNGSVSLILSTSAVNFSLLFETEQISIIESFAGLLNSLSFPIQIVIRSKRLDVSSYINNLKIAQTKQTNPKLQEMISHYLNFVSSIIKENNVLDKQFYVCLNVTSIELGVFHKSGSDFTKKAMTALIPRRDHLIRQLGQLGLKARQLKTVELVKLFYDFYNPSTTESADTPFESALAPAVKPATPSLVAISPSPQEPVQTQSNLPTPSPKAIPFIPPPNNQPPVPKPASVMPLTPSYPPVVGRINTPFVVEELPDDNGP